MASYTLMNETTPVLDFAYDLEAHTVTKVGTVHNAAAAPLGLFDEHGQVTRKDIDYWWRHRAIPSSREQIDRLLQNLDLDTTLELAERTFGLSLSDRYWINDRDHPQRWENINFFDNDFSDDLGILTLGQDSGSGGSPVPDYRSTNLTSPNATVDGDLRKKWKLVGGTHVLVKAGVGFANQEPYNEVVATGLHRRLLQPGDYTPYRLFEENRRVYSACDNMLGPHEELVSAYDLIRRRKQRNTESDLAFYVRCCEELGIPNMMEHLAKMFACDFVIANRDRHWRNFGVIRNVQTLHGVRPAPIFDTGSCLWSDQTTLELPVDFCYTAKPFKREGMRPYEQLKLFAAHLDWLDPAALDGFDDEVAAVLGSNPNMGPARLDAIVAQVRRNMEALCTVARLG